MGSNHAGPEEVQNPVMIESAQVRLVCPLCPPFQSRNGVNRLWTRGKKRSWSHALSH